MRNLLRPLVQKLIYSELLARWTQKYAERKIADTAKTPPDFDKDGLPVPPALLMATTGGHARWKSFEKGGRQAILAFADLVNRNGGDFRHATRMLDFGCGCGRLARHAPKHTDADFFGVDYNATLVDWCAANLPGTYRKNQLKPPLDFPDAHFDVMYLLSVFTHLRIPTQTAWLKEYRRVLKPGGFCLITFHDEAHKNLAQTGVSPDQLAKDGFTYFNNSAEGSNFLSTFQTRAQLSELVSPHFELCEIVPSNESVITQAIAVLRAR